MTAILIILNDFLFYYISRKICVVKRR